MKKTSPLALYVHWPFCAKKCPYCDFNSHVGHTIEVDTWQQAYASELAFAASQTSGHSLSSIFIGGGTPSLMPPALVASILNVAAKHWEISQDCEITLEANPGSADADHFHGYRAAGVNRLSVGVQALDDDVLKFLGRLHDSASARRAVALANQIFPRTSFDLIYAYANHTPTAWATTLREALSMAGEHLSVYQLTLEPQTAFYAAAAQGQNLVADADTAATLYELTQELLAPTHPAYEISNHARAGAESRHNLTYWHYGAYAGVGPGAHGRLVAATGATRATLATGAPQAWLQQVQTAGHGWEISPLSPTTAMSEALMLGLRLTTGIDRARWQARFGVDVLEFLGGHTTLLAALKAENYADWDQEKFWLTAAGRLRQHGIVKRLLAN